MLIKEISSLLGEELAKQVEEKLGDVELGIANNGSFVPAEKHDSMKSELKEYKSKLEESSKLVEELNKKAGLADEWKTKADDWETKYKTFEGETEKRLSDYQKRSALKDLLSDKMAKSAIDLVVDKYNLEDLSLGEKGITDADKILGGIKENYSDLFIETTQNSHTKNDNTQVETVTSNDKLRQYMGLPPVKN